MGGGKSPVNSYLNQAGWITFTLALNNQWGQDKLYGGVWDLQYVEGQGWTLYNVGYAGYVNDAGGTAAAPQYWKLYKADVDINGITITDVRNDVAEAKSILNSKMGTAAKTALQNGLPAAEAATEDNALATYNTFHPILNKAKESILFYSSVAPYIGVEEKIDGTGRAYLRENGYFTISQQYADGTLDENSAGSILASIKELFYNSVKAQRTPGSSMTLAIINPSFETGTLEGWTSQDGGNVQSNRDFPGLKGDIYFEKWTGDPSLSNGSLKQTIKGLPNGTYKLTAEMQNVLQSENNAPREGYYLVANDDRTAVTFQGETVSVTTVVRDGNLTIGTVIENCTGNKACVDNFQLTYVKALEETPKPSEFDGTPITLASSYNATLEVGENEVCKLTFNNQNASCVIDHLPIDNTVTQSITFEFAEPAPVNFSVPVDVLAEGQEQAKTHWRGFDAGTTNYTLDLGEFSGSITKITIFNVQQSGQHSLMLKAAYLTQKDGTKTNLKLSDAWGTTISATSGNVTFSGLWAVLPLKGIENIEEGLKLRIYTDDNDLADKVQFAVKYADDNKEDWPHIGSRVNNYYLTTISRPVSSIGLQWKKEEAGSINIKAITWEKDKEIFPGITVTAKNKWATYISQVERPVPTDLRAFTCDDIDAENALVLTEVFGPIPANTPCILYNPTDGDLTIDRIFGDIQAKKDPCTTGLLTGVYHKTFVPAGSYILQKQGEDTGFFICDQPNTITVARNRCYLTVPAAAAAKSRSFIFNEPGTTGIPSVQGSISKMMNGSDIYDAQGRKLKSMQKGINIINGVKVRIK